MPLSADSEVLEEFECVLMIAEDFIQSVLFETFKSPGAFIDKGALYTAIKSVFIDIQRYKEYHLRDPVLGRVNSVKKAAYTCKWINKIKPIQQNSCIDINKEGTDGVASLLVNCALSLYIAQIYIQDDLGAFFNYNDNYYSEFLYDLFYRNIGEDGLLHIFQNIHSAVAAGRAGVLDIIGSSEP